MAVAHYLTRLCAAGRQTHPVDHTVETALQATEQVLARDALHFSGFFEGDAELGFEDTVNAANFLLFTQLQAVTDQLRFAVFPVLSRNKVAALDGALVRMTAF